MSTHLLAVLAAAVLLATPAAAANPELLKAEKFFDQLRYSEAETALKNAFGVPRNDRKTILRIYELRGIIDATTGKPSALEHFRKLVALAPDHVLSRDLGPRILAPFYEAKARLDENPPVRLVTSSPSIDGTLRLKAGVQSDGLRMVSRIAVSWRQPDGQWTSKVVPAKQGFDQAVEGDAVDWFVTGLGAYEGTVLQAGSKEQPLKAATVLPPPPVADQPVGLGAEEPERPMSTRRKLAIGVAGAGAGALIAAGAFGLSSRSARGQFDNPQRDDAGRLIGITADRTRALESQAVSSAIAANVLVTAGAALVGVGVFLWLGDPGEGAVVVVPALGGVALVGTLP